MTRFVLAAVLSSLFCAPVFAAAQDFDDETRQAFDTALQSYRRALASTDPAERQSLLNDAFVAFQTVFQRNPSSDSAYAFMRRAGEDVIAGMMNSSDRNIQETGRMIYELARPGQAIRRDRAVIQEYVNGNRTNPNVPADQRHDGLRDSRTAMWQLCYWHLKNIGPYAVRDLLPVLGNPTEDTLRARVIMLLTEMRWDATLALVAALKSRNVLLRQNAAITLGHIRDERAIPYLKEIVEDANENPGVVRYAHEALSRVTRQHPQQWRTAEEYYLRLAEQCYYSHPDVVHDWQPNDLIWSWDVDADRLVEREVPRFAFNEQAAEQVLYDMIDLNPDHAGAYGLLAAVHFAQKIEATIALDAARRDGSPAVAQIETLLADVERAVVLGALSGRPYVYLALARSLQDGRSEIAVECIEALRRMGNENDLPNIAPQADPSAFGTPLSEALACDDKRVRYHAAFAWAELNPQVRKIGMELVIPNLVDALGEQGVRVALVAHEAADQADWDAINGLRRTLEGVGGFPVLAHDVSETMLRARSFPTEDVIFMDFRMASRVVFEMETVTRGQVTENLFMSLWQDVRTRQIPVVIICHNDEELGMAQQILSGRAAAFITPDASRVDMRQLFNALFTNQDDAKAYADALAARAAEALAGLDTQNTFLPYLTAVDALMASAAPDSGRPDPVRVPSLRALGHFADVRSLEVMAAVLADANMSVEAHLAAAEGLADHFAISNAAPSDTTLTAMTEAMFHADLNVARAVGRALGAARLTGEQRRALENRRRIQRPENP